MSYLCASCGLYDSYRGRGDGIGSCDCPRCDCCGAGPQECDCRMDWDGVVDEPIDDYLCNDTTCPYRQARQTPPGGES